MKGFKVYQTADLATNDPASKADSAEAGSRRPPRRLLLQGLQYHWFAACLPAAVKPPLSPSTVTWRSRAGISRRTGSHLKARGESRSQLVKLNDAGLHHHDEASSTRYPRDAVLRRAQSSLGPGSWCRFSTGQVSSCPALRSAGLRYALCKWRGPIAARCRYRTREGSGLAAQRLER